MNRFGPPPPSRQATIGSLYKGIMKNRKEAEIVVPMRSAIGTPIKKRRKENLSYNNSIDTNSSRFKA